MPDLSAGVGDHAGARRLKVLIAVPFGLGGKGGIDRIMDEVAIGVAARPDLNVDVSVIATRGGGSLAASPFVTALFIAKLLALKMSGQVDLVHINTAQRGSIVRKAVVAKAARLLRIPYLVHIHGSQFRQYWNEAGPASALRLVQLIDGAARIIVLGGVWRTFLISKRPDAADKIVILPNATRAAVSIPRAPDGLVHILFLGRIGERKGTPQLVEALARIAHLPGWRATIAGDGDVIGTQAAAERLGIASRLTFPGWVGPEDVQRLLASADILTLPSFDENLPMSVIEGMAYGVAVVTTPVGAVEDIIEHGKTGLLTPPGDAEALAEALGQAVQDPELRARLGSAARAFHAEHLEIDGYLRRLAAIWRSVAARA